MGQGRIPAAVDNDERLCRLANCQALAKGRGRVRLARGCRSCGIGLGWVGLDDCAIVQWRDGVGVAMAVCAREACGTFRVWRRGRGEGGERKGGGGRSKQKKGDRRKPLLISVVFLLLRYERSVERHGKRDSAV